MNKRQTMHEHRESSGGWVERSETQQNGYLGDVGSRSSTPTYDQIFISRNYLRSSVGWVERETQQQRRLCGVTSALPPHKISQLQEEMV